MKKLSIIIPAYNEESTLEQIIRKVEEITLPRNILKEITIINDCSKDKTLSIAEDLKQKYHNISVINNVQNLGKTQSVKKGILKSSGDYVIIQDADLEYDPKDIERMLSVALKDRVDVVYGNRFNKDNVLIYKSFYLGNKIVTFISNIFTYPRIKKYIPDMEVCYKLIKGNIARKVAKNISAKSSFGLEPEITARLARYNKDLKWSIVSIKYSPRTIEQGKKIRYSDGLKAVIEIIKYNLF